MAFRGLRRADKHPSGDSLNSLAALFHRQSVGDVGGIGGTPRKKRGGRPKKRKGCLRGCSTGSHGGYLWQNPGMAYRAIHRFRDDGFFLFPIGFEFVASPWPRCSLPCLFRSWLAGEAVPREVTDLLRWNPNRSKPLMPGGAAARAAAERGHAAEFFNPSKEGQPWVR